MATQKENGNAFEWAVGLTISKLYRFKIVTNDFAKTNQLCFETKISQEKREHFLNAARHAIEHINTKEHFDAVTTGEVVFQSDAMGQKGDVRDLIIQFNHKAIGISCKTNHADLKHSRLSDKLNFVKKWGLHEEGVSEQYWANIRPIFQKLRQTKQKNPNALWEDHADKANQVYWPVLNAFSDEITRIQALGTVEETQLCKAILSYAIGRHDFYKIIARTTAVEIQAFNFNHSLNTSKPKFPKNINAINSKNGGQYSKTITFTGGYALNFRIHNASSRIEPSLKFAISAIGFPQKDIYQHHIDLTQIFH